MTLNAEVSFDAFGKELGLFGFCFGNVNTLFKHKIAMGTFWIEEICYLMP